MAPTGAIDRFMSTTGNFELLADGGDVFSFFDNTPYTLMLNIERTGTETLNISTSLMVGTTLVTSYSAEDVAMIEDTFDMLGLHANSNTFGSSSERDMPDNGLDFTNIAVSVTTGGSAMWRGYEVITDADGSYAFTEGWLGTLKVDQDPWVYSYSLNKWIFLSEGSTSGAWAYVPR
jgi:hypothetical protein